MGNFKSPKLTPYNYATWSIKMWYHLMHNGVSQYVEGTLPKPAGDNVTQSSILEWVNLDRQALSVICLTQEIFHIQGSLGHSQKPI